MHVTFDEVMSFHPDNPDVYDEIVDEFEGLIPFVGAGLTAPVYGMWKDVLIELGRKLTNETTIANMHALLDAKKYLEAAQLLEDSRGRINIERNLVKHFSRKKLRDGWPAVKEGAIWLLPELFNCPVLTTNFDEVIEEVYRSRGHKDFNVLDPTKQALRHQAKLRNKLCLFKIHGTISDGMTDYSSLVLTKRQYDECYAEHGEAVSILRDFLSARAMLFLGCSLEQDKTVDVLKDVFGMGCINYAIASCDPKDMDGRVLGLANAGIRAILYEDGKYDSVRAVLEHLREDQQRTQQDDKLAATGHFETREGRPSTTVMYLVGKSDKLTERINSRLMRQRENHPSFRLMGDEPVEDLFPKGQEKRKEDLIPNALRRVDVADETVSFRHFIENSWKSERQSHLFITGRGGVGKTVALLTFATEKGFLPKSVPAIYIPLNDLSPYSDARRRCIDCYIEHNFSDRECHEIVRLSHEQWDEGPRVIILLDGHNEIPANRKDDVNVGIRAWAERAGTQLVTTSRVPGIFGIANTSWLDLHGLSEDEVEEYLDKRGVDAPSCLDKRLRRILETPLMLKIYADVEGFLKTCNASKLKIKPSDSAGHLMWNYLQRELWRVNDNNVGDFTKAEYEAAVLLVMPYLCWRMESCREFMIDADTFDKYVRDACVYWQLGSRPKDDLLANWMQRDPIGTLDSTRIVEALRDIVAEETGLVAWDGRWYSILHQSLRDGFAAIHLNSVMYTSSGTVPEELWHPISEYVKDYLSDVAEDDVLLSLWNANRDHSVTREVVTYNLLRLIHSHCHGNLNALNCSDMDLSSISLFPFRHGIRLEVSRKPEFFEGTRLNAECFKPQGHSDSVNSVSFNPDGTLLASCSTDGTARLWDPMTGRQVGQPLEDYGQSFSSVCFSPDGKLLAIGSHNGAVRLLDASTRQWGTRVLGGRGIPVTSVCFSPRDALLASGEEGGEVTLWSTRSGRILGAPLKGHQGRVTSVCFSPDGQLLASGSHDGSVHLWNPTTGQRVGKPLGPYDLYSNPQRQSQMGLRAGRYGLPVTSIGFNNNGSLLASGSRDGSVRLWDPMTGRQVYVLTGHTDWVTSVCFSYDGSLLASGSRDGTIRLWDPATGRPIGKPLGGHRLSVAAVCFSPDGYMLASGSGDGTVRLWDSAAGRLIGEPLGGHRNRVTISCFDADGSTLATGSEDGSLRLWNTVSGRQTGKQFGGYGLSATSVCFGPKGTLLVSGCSDGTISLWQCGSGYRIGKPVVAHEERVTSVCFDSRGEMLATASADGVICLWNVRKKQADEMLRLARNPIKGHRYGVSSVCFSPDGKLLASGSWDGTVRLWDSATGVQVGKGFIGHRHGVSSVCFNPDGRLLASGSWDGTVRLWDTRVGSPVGEPIGSREQSVRCVCFSPEGSLLASGSANGGVRIWDSKTGNRVLSLQAKQAWPIDSVRFSVDGELLVSGLANGSFWLWSVHYAEVGVHPSRFSGSIEPLFDIDLAGLNFSHAIIENKRDREVLRQNGVIL